MTEMATELSLESVCFLDRQKEDASYSKRKILRNQVGEFSVCQFILRVTKITEKVLHKEDILLNGTGRMIVAVGETRYARAFPTLIFVLHASSGKRESVEQRETVSRENQVKEEKGTFEKNVHGGQGVVHNETEVPNVEESEL